MTNDELYALLADRMGSEPHYLAPGEENRLGGADGRGWMGILDDRSPGSYGPATFDGPMFRKVLGSTTLIFIDYATQAGERFYDLLRKAVECGTRLLVIQTPEGRDEEWLEYLRARWVGGHFDVVPQDSRRSARGRLCIRRSASEAKNAA